MKKSQVKSKAKAPVSKGSKSATARKTAEAKKAAKKAVRMTMTQNDTTPVSNKKGRSLIAQSKKAKKK